MKIQIDVFRAPCRNLAMISQVYCLPCVGRPLLGPICTGKIRGKFPPPSPLIKKEGKLKEVEKNTTNYVQIWYISVKWMTGKFLSPPRLQNDFDLPQMVCPACNAHWLTYPKITFVRGKKLSKGLKHWHNLMFHHNYNFVWFDFTQLLYHCWMKIGNMICARHLITSRAVSNIFN